MPAVNPGRVSVNAAGKGTGKRRVKRVRVKAAAAPKKPTVVAPADRVSERVETRRKQLKVSVKRAGDAPQNRAQDTARAEKFKRTDRYVQTVQDAAPKPTKILKVVKGQPVPDSKAEIRKVLAGGKRSNRVPAPAMNRMQTVTAAPALRVLDQTTRPIHAIAAGTDAAVQGRNVPKAALRGIQNKDKTTFSTVLRHAGVKNKKVAGVAGFVLDVGLDPTTYLTAGTGSVVRKAAVKGATKEARGVVVKMAGKEVPGVRRATAKAGEGGGKVLRKVVPERARNAVRDAASEVNPNVAPSGVDKATHEASRRIARKARASTGQGDREAINLAHGIKTKIGAANYAKVTDAIEADNVASLPAGLRAHVETVRGLLDEILKKQRAAGLKVGKIKHRPQVHVPPVTADTSRSAKTLASAHRAEASAGRRVESAQAAHDIHQGRAEVLSRNVGDVAGEKAAARGRRKRKVKIPAVYAAGGHGVQQTATELAAANAALKTATTARETAHSAHEAEKITGATQRAEKAAAEKVNAKRATAAKGYVPHKLTPDAVKADNKKAARVSGASPASSKARKDTRPMAELRVAEPGRYRQDLHATVAERMAEGTASTARAVLAKDLADLGREIPRGRKPHLTDQEAVYKLKDGKLTEVDTGTAEFLKKPPTGKVLKAKYVVLNRKLYDRTVGTVGGSKGGTILHGYDKVQSGFKRTALATAAFHIRNAIGDTAQAYVHQPGQKLPGNMVRAGRVLKAAGRIEKSQQALETSVKSGSGKLKTKHYGHVTYEEAAQNLIDAGAARSGYTSRELRDLSTSGDKKLKLPKSPAGLRRAFLNREDLPRLATAIHALQNGATYEEAAAKVAGAHFDYAELTSFERDIARRIAPFYTWTARNVPLQAKRLVTNPGKYAAFQKVREEAAALSRPDEIDPKTRDLYRQLEAAGVKLGGGWEKYLTSYEQRNVGVPVSWKGHKFTVSAGLPLSDLNELPGMSGPGEYLNKAASLVTPIVKDPVEFGFNYSFFFRDQIERDNSPLVAAPSFVGKWPDSARKKFGVVKAQDKRSGKMIWQWPGKADYVAHIVPGLPATAVKLMTPGHDQQGKGIGSKLLGAASGIKATPVDARTNAINLAYARGQEIQKRQTVLRKQNNPANGRLISAKNPTPEYTRLALQLRTVNTIAYQGKDARGDAVLPKQGGPKRGRSSNGRVRIPGVSGRVKVPGGAGGRVKVP